MNNRISWSAATGVAFLLLGAAVGCRPRPEPPATVAAAVPNGHQAVLSITGMASAADADTVQQALSAVPGVAGVALSLEENTATVTYDAARTNPPALLQAVATARGLSSYTATVKAEK
jgi:copper chaperone CopZ